MEKYLLPNPPDPEVFREADEIDLEIGRLDEQEEYRARRASQIYLALSLCIAIGIGGAWILNIFTHTWKVWISSWWLLVTVLWFYLYYILCGNPSNAKHETLVKQLKEKTNRIHTSIRQKYISDCLEVIDAYYNDNIYGMRLNDSEWDTRKEVLHNLIDEANRRIHLFCRGQLLDYFRSYTSYLRNRDIHRGRFDTKAVSYSRAGVQRRNRMGPTERVKGYGSSERQYVFDHAARMAVGEAGEKFVVRSEKKRLIRLGRPDLADRVHRVSESHGDGLGYDVISYTKEGIRKFIEVKATKGNRISEFFISRNELEFLRPGKGIERWLFLVCLGDSREGPAIKRISAKRFNASAALEVVEYDCTYAVQENGEDVDSKHIPGQ